MWWVVKHCNMLPRVVVQFPSVEIFKTQLDLVPHNLLYGPCLSVWDVWNQMTFRDAFPQLCDPGMWDDVCFSVDLPNFWCWLCFLTIGIVALWSLALLAFERYIVICRPLRNTRLRGKHAALGIAFVWIFSFIWTVPPTMGWSSYTTSKIGTTCEPNW